MPKIYPIHIREMAVIYAENNTPKAQITRKFGISRATLWRWINSDTLDPKTDYKRREEKFTLQDLRRHVQCSIGKTLTYKEIGEYFGVSATAVYKKIKNDSYLRKLRNKRSLEKRGKTRLRY